MVEKIIVEDDRTGLAIETLKRAFADNLFYVKGKFAEIASDNDLYQALAYTVRDRLLHRWINTHQTYINKDVRVVGYLSAEFLLGPHLGNALLNLNLYEPFKNALEECCLDVDKLAEHEPEPGLGNGGLGRLAACFLDSLATLDIPAIGYGIRYEFGIFNQLIENGWQIERTDKWLHWGNPWELPRPEYTVEVNLGGNTESFMDEKGNYKVRWVPHRIVRGVPYDTPIPGYKTNTAITLRLWSAEAHDSFDLQAFNTGDYLGAVSAKLFSENISKVLYPNDESAQGKQLRLEQQYFFVACSLKDIIRMHTAERQPLTTLHKKFSLQLNDTHPSVAVAELMRLLVDEHDIDWELAWDITVKTFGYTNHTLLPEALERWPVSLFGKLLPRHLEIIYEINRRFLDEISHIYPGDEEKLSRLSLIDETGERYIRMAHLAALGSHSINGVAELHTRLLKESVLKEFYEIFPERFNNKTNGVTPRRWLQLSNSRLATLITKYIGEAWTKNLDELRRIEQFTKNPGFRSDWEAVKLGNKEKLAHLILKQTGVKVNPASLFDVQVKRFHEYKRQALSALHIIWLYQQLKNDPRLDVTARTFIFGGKSAPGYYMAKLIIKLINSIATVVNNDPDVRDLIKVVFLPNFSVKLGQQVYPAADLSEQISTAGKEASGTGNMKFSMNGALTIGTLDGANVEIREEVGEDNFFLFGLTEHEVRELKTAGYNPYDYYENNPQLKAVIDAIADGSFSQGDCELFKPLVNALLYDDQYMLMADFQSYIDCQKQVAETFRNRELWTTMSILNVARTGKFSSDRTIREYCQDIWQVEPVKIEIQDYHEYIAGFCRVQYEESIKL